MQSNIEKQLITTITLNADEAHILKSLMQNGPPDQPEIFVTFREELFNLLPSFEDLQSTLPF